MTDSEDSAPEEVSFKNAQEEALYNIEGAAQAVRDQKEKQRQIRKRRAEVRKDEKEKKLAKLADLESKKLSGDFLESIAPTTPADTPSATNYNRIKSFECESAGETEEELDAKEEEDSVLDAGATHFNVVSSKEILKDSKHRSNNAWDFKQSMMFGSGVAREPHHKKQVQKLKQAAAKSSIIKA